MADVKLSKLLSRILRHRPDIAGIQLDAQGWGSLDELIHNLREKGKDIDQEQIETVVALNDKQRFELDLGNRRIRALHGHTVPVDLDFPPAVPPVKLYHGTAVKYLEGISERGLLKRKRQHVHLSADIPTALQVGGRHGKAVVLTIRALEMYQAGLTFFHSPNGVWLTDHVPVEYISFTHIDEH